MTHQLHHVFRLFIRVICSWYRPLVMLIDDLQWADHASLELMEVLMTDRENTGLLLIGCYRSNEVVGGTHSMSTWRRKLKEKSDQDEKQQGGQNHGQCDGGFSVKEIEIGYLGLDETNKIIMALLSIDDPTRTMPLAEICQKRTLGSPFFVIYLIKVLEHESYLQFNLGQLQWTWDVVQIDEETTLTDNAVEIMMKKMESVHHDLGTLLKITSMLGSHFSRKVLSIVWMKVDDQLDDQRLDECLEEAVALSFLEASGTDGYRWPHDKVQEAGRSLISDAELPSFQFDIGMILLRNLSSEDLDSLIFIVVSLLNSKDCNDEEINVEIASLCSDAANKAKDLSAFDTTLRFAKTGINHLTSDRRWENTYDLTLNLFRTAAESAGILANTEELRMFCVEVLANGRDILDKIPVYSSLALDMGRDGRFAEAIEICLDAIKQLGVVKVRRNGISQAMVVFSNLFKTKKQLAKLDANSLPIMVDSKQIQTMKLLDIICSYSFETKNLILMLDACIKQAQLTIRHGISSAAPTALAQFGLIVSGALNDLTVGTKIADDATSMVPRLHGNVSEALLVARTWGFMYGYSRPLHSSLRHFLYGYAEGMKFGDTEMASWCLANHTMASFMLGKNLRTINDDCRIYIHHMRDLGWDEIAEITSSIHQAALYLMEWQERDDPGVLLFNDLVGEPKFHQLSRPWSRIQVYAYLCDYQVGAEYAISIGDLYMDRGAGHQTCQADAFTRCVCLYAASRTTRKRKYKRKARSLRKVLQGWEKDGCMNLRHQLCLLNAEDAALDGRRHCLEALEYYEEGISASNRIGNLRDAGLISERYANFLLNDMKDEDRARFHVEQSIRYYDEWGAKRSVGMLRLKYSNILLVPKLPVRSLEIAKEGTDNSQKHGSSNLPLGSSQHL
mmetsp:Transcript_28109/g.68351  ORF Transcript_28109/g.68351 Transcript_28109/m.68351 type:complete len:902 (+) Transcript_28109:634-3339(+)